MWDRREGLPELSAAGLRASSACSSLLRAVLIVPDSFYLSTGLAVLLWMKALNNTLQLSRQGAAKHRRGHFSDLCLLTLSLPGKSKVI